MQGFAREHRPAGSNPSDTSAFEWGRSVEGDDSGVSGSDQSPSPDYHRVRSREVKTFDDVDQVAIHFGETEKVGTRLVVRRDDGTSLTLGNDRSGFEWVGNPRDSKFEWGSTARSNSDGPADSSVRRLAVFLEK